MKENGQSTEEMVQSGWAIVYELELYGVVSEERLLENPNY